MNKLSVATGLTFAVLLAWSGTPAMAGKPAAHDPVRAEIVRAVRQHPALVELKGKRLDIRRIWASDRLGYLCTLVIDQDGRHQRTDQSYDVLQIVLQHQDDRWTPVARLDGLSEDLQHVQCASDAKGQVTDAFLDGLATNPTLALKAPTPP